MKARPGAFTLVEVAAALGIAVFALVTLLVLFPIGLREGAASILETRGAHLAQTIFATLETGRFEEVTLFGSTLNLAELGEEDAPLLLHATYPVSGAVAIAPPGGADADYRLELRFRKLETPGGRVSGNRVTLLITPTRFPGEIVRFQSVIGNF